MGYAQPVLGGYVGYNAETGDTNALLTDATLYQSNSEVTYELLKEYQQIELLKSISKLKIYWEYRSTNGASWIDIKVMWTDGINTEEVKVSSTTNAAFQSDYEVFTPTNGWKIDNGKIQFYGRERVASGTTCELTNIKIIGIQSPFTGI